MLLAFADRKSTDGLARSFSTIFSELRNAVFADVAQRAIRRVAKNVFSHLLQLDAQFHLSRQTGGLTRAVDRGQKCVNHLMLHAVTLTRFPQRHLLPPNIPRISRGSDCIRNFYRLWYPGASSSVMPSISKVILFSLQTYNFGISYASITLSTMAAYTWFTVRTTAWRTRFRQEANKADNAAASTSLDSLINYEAVKVILVSIERSDKAAYNAVSTSTTSRTRLNSLTTP